MATQVTEFNSECNKAKIYVQNDMPIGLFHDFLMAIKGMMVDRMVAAHQEQTTHSEAMKQQPPHESELPSLSEAEVAPVACASACEESKGT